MPPIEVLIRTPSPASGCRAEENEAEGQQAGHASPSNGPSERLRTRGTTHPRPRRRDLGVAGSPRRHPARLLEAVAQYPAVVPPAPPARRTRARDGERHPAVEAGAKRANP